MATTSGTYIGGTNKQIKWTIAGLENPTASYNGFRVNTSDGKFVTWNDGTLYDFTNAHACGAYITGTGEALLNGTWYSCGTSSSVYTEICPDTTPPTIVLSFTRYNTSFDIAWNSNDSDFYSTTIQIGNSSGGPFRDIITSYAANASATQTTDYNGVTLSPGTTYYFPYSVRDNTGNVRTYSPFAVATTAGSPPNAPTNFSFVTIDATNRIYDVSWTASAGATSYEVDAYYSGTRAIKYQGSSTTGRVTLDLNGTTYQIEIYAKNSNGTSSALIGYITTNGAAPPGGGGTPDTLPPGNSGLGDVGAITINKQYPDPTNLSYFISFSGLGVSNYRVYKRESGTTQWYLLYNGAWTGSDGPYTFDKKGTLYEVQVYACNNSTAGTCGLPSHTTFTTSTNLPGPFNWNPAITANATFNMTATQWNSFTTRINDFRAAKSLAAYTFTNVTVGNPFKADHYNEARNGIYGMNGNIPPFRNPGESVLASDLNGLTTALNAIT